MRREASISVGWTAILITIAVMSVALNGCGGVGATRNGSSQTIQAPLTISAIAAGNITTTGATITWSTSVPATSNVEYGTTSNYGSRSALDNGMVTSHSQALSGLAPGQAYHFRVSSKDAAGNTATSVDNTFTTAATADLTAPSVAIIAPTAGSTVSNTVTVSATASDNLGVAGVQLLVDGNNLGTEVTSSPYSVAWNTLSTSNGSHTLTARARDAAGNSTTSAGVIVTVSNSTTSSASDFSIRCSDSNVVRCINFDNEADVAPYLHPAWDGVIRGEVDNVTYASGGGSLRFLVPATSNANTSGDFAIDFANDYSVQFGNGSPNGNEFYIQWRQRFDSNFVSLNASSSGGGGPKQLIVGIGSANAPNGETYVASSCTDLHLVVSNVFYHGFPILYHNCGDKDDSGYEGLYPAVSPPGDAGDFLLQNAIQCLYHSSVDNFPNCFKYFPDEWMTFQLHVKAGRDYSPPSESSGLSGCQTSITQPCNPNSRNYHRDSTVELWMARENQPAVLVVSIPDYDLVQHDTLGTGVYPGDTFWASNDMVPRYGKVWLLPYDTGRTTSVTYVDANTWYDELIISKRRIPDPNVLTPNAPDNLLAVVSSATRVDLTWRINPGPQAESGFKIERCAGDMYQTCYTNLANFTEIGSVPTGVNTFSDTTAQAEQAYTYRVRAFNGVGNSAYTNAAMNTPGQPSDLSVNAATGGTANLKWVRNAPLDETGFVVERCVGTFSYSTSAPCNSGSAFSQVGTAPAGATTFTDSGLATGTTYTWRLKSLNQAGSYQGWQNTGPSYSNKASAIAQ